MPAEAVLAEGALGSAAPHTWVDRAGGVAQALIAWVRRYGWWLLLVGGLGAATGLVVQVGPARLWEVLLEAGPIIPVIIALDVVWMGMEGMALLRFYGPVRAQIPRRIWVRALITHYATMSILPVGRVGAEVARATMLAPYVGSHRVTAGAAQMQVMVLIGNALICVPCFIFAAQLAGWWHGLSLLLIGNFLANGLLGIGLHLFTRNVPLGGWLARRFERMVHWGPGLDEVFQKAPAVPVVPGLFCILGRSAQAVQYGLVLAAVGGAFSLDGIFISEGIHLAAAALGDMVPNQIGVSEGMYRFFADLLGLGAHPERALAIPIMIRVANFTAAGLCFAALRLWPSRPAV